MLLQLGSHHRACAVGSRQSPRLHTGRACVIAAAKKPQQKKKRKGAALPVEQRIVFDEADEDDENHVYVDTPQIMRGGPPMPTAPAPSDVSEGIVEGSGYVVFAPKPSSIQQIRGGAWGWDEDDAPGGSAARPPTPEWNPRTGFMGTEEEQRAREASGAAASTSGAATADVQSLLSVPALATDTPLPSVPKDQILSSCFGTSLGMTLAGLFLRQYALANATQVLGTDPRLLSDMLKVPSGFESWENAGIVVGAVLLVTGARLQLMSAWPEFRSATNRSNKQILEPLGWFDILLVATLTGLSEELLFRGAIIPASFPDWRGALLSGVIFGLLHNSGGRNLAFAAWASAVGVFYGGLFVYTHNLWVPATAHALANFSSAAVWKAKTGPKADPTE